MTRIDTFKAIPDYSELREAKKNGYLDHPLDTEHTLHDAPLIAIGTLGIRGSSYYSRPSRVAPNGIPGVSADVLTREPIAEKLHAVNEHLRTDASVSDALGGTVELDVRDGARTLELQDSLYEEHYPALLRQLNPDWSAEEILAKRDQVIARGNPNSPHVSGGAVDVNLAYAKTGEAVFNAQGTNIAKAAVNPEYLEWVVANIDNPDADIPQEIKDLSPSAFRRALLARRTLYNVMADPEIGNLSLIVNPVEVWHYGAGDKLSESMRSLKEGRTIPAYYGPAKEPK